MLGPGPPAPSPLPPALVEESSAYHLSPGHFTGRKLAHVVIFSS